MSIDIWVIFSMVCPPKEMDGRMICRPDEYYPALVQKVIIGIGLILVIVIKRICCDVGTTERLTCRDPFVTVYVEYIEAKHYLRIYSAVKFRTVDDLISG